ncbi:MAG: cell division protein ZapA [Chloroflexi bacterium]|nr:cell division protein ZapA [Chloroflexota bacterium]
MSKAPINISILDKDYKIACPPGEQAGLLASADYLDSKMREIRDNGSIIGSERIAVITALNIAHELLNTKQPQNGLDGDIPDRLKRLEDRISAALHKVRQSEI